MMIKYKWAAPGTCWNYNLDTISRVRMDTLFGINKLYTRKYRHYVWQIHIGRLMICLDFTKRIKK